MKVEKAWNRTQSEINSIANPNGNYKIIQT